MIQATIDLGTNTCLLLVAEWDEKKRRIEKVLGDYSTIVRLGEGVDQQRELQPAPMQRTLSCLKEYSSRLRNFGGDPAAAICVATSQARDARNSDAFFSQVEKETGFRFRVISGEEEARLTFLGALLPGMNPKESSVIDIGGGSTEIISLGSSKSIDIGSVRFTERFLKTASSATAVTDEQFWACQEAIDLELESLLKWKSQQTSSPASLIGVAGTVTTLAAWHLGLTQFDAEKIDGIRMTRGDVHRMVEELKWRTSEERRQLPGIEPMRADVILAGSLILWRVMELLEFSECCVSTRGLRYGALELI
jgi:exopolyphosphatase/guanosine-5'-triphosphate,3'-diphosphate pyrophosphatase